MIEADRADHSRAKLDHDLIVPITNNEPLFPSAFSCGLPLQKPFRSRLLILAKEGWLKKTRHTTQSDQDQANQTCPYPMMLLGLITKETAI